MVGVWKSRAYAASSERSQAAFEGFSAFTANAIPMAAFFLGGIVVGCTYYAFLYGFSEYISKCVEKFLEFIDWWVALVIKVLTELFTKTIGAVTTGITGSIKDGTKAFGEGLSEGIGSLFSGATTGIVGSVIP